jgi:hypothetical protein
MWAVVLGYSVAGASAATVTLSSATGCSEGTVDVNLAVSPRQYLTGFSCIFEYNPAVLRLDDIFLSDAAAANGIHRLWYTETMPGSVEITTESWGDGWLLEKLSEIAVLRFAVLSAVPPGATRVSFVGPVYYTDDETTAPKRAGTVPGEITVLQKASHPENWE